MAELAAHVAELHAGREELARERVAQVLRAAAPELRRLARRPEDGAGRRVGKRVDGVLTRGWLYADALNPAAELDDAGNLVSRFVYGSRAHVPNAMIQNGAVYAIVSDYLGSVRLVVDTTTGAVVQRLDYDAWGNVTAEMNSGFQPFGFAGGLYDPDTGLVRFGARDYDPQVGRWTQKDPIRFVGGQSNLYAYSANDAVNRIDSSGKQLDSLSATCARGSPSACAALGLPPAAAAAGGAAANASRSSGNTFCSSRSSGGGDDEADDDPPGPPPLPPAVDPNDLVETVQVPSTQPDIPDPNQPPPPSGLLERTILIAVQAVRAISNIFGGS